MIMLTIAVGLVLGQGTLFNSLVTHPDPANGYEDYVRAAGMLEDGKFGLYRSWESFVYNGKADGDSPDLPSDLNPSDPDLTVREHIAQRFRSALESVAAGNRKGVYDPRGRFTLDTTFPELTHFKNLAFCESFAASVDFAHGRSDIAVDELIEGLRFASRISVGTLIQRLVGIASESILEAEISRHLPQLSLEDAQKLQAFADEELASHRLGATLRREGQMTAAAVEPVLSDPTGDLANSLFPSDDQESKAVSEAIQKLTPAERQALVPQVIQRIKDFANQEARVLDGPEESWLSEAKALDINDGTVASQFASVVMPAYQQYIVVEARTRAKARLLRLNAMAIEYRWINGRLPDSLDQFTDPEDRKDPLSGASFNYRRIGDWYTLTSHGFGPFKTIDLKPMPPDATVDQTIRP